MDADAYTRRIRDLQRRQATSSDPDRRKAAGREAERVRKQWQLLQQKGRRS